MVLVFLINLSTFSSHTKTITLRKISEITAQKHRLSETRMREFKEYICEKREKVDVSRRPPEVGLSEGDVTGQILIGLWEEAARGCASCWS